MLRCYGGTMSDENDKPLNLDVPEHLSYSEDHVWVDQTEDLAIVGVTEYAVNELGDLVFVDLPEPGTQIEAGDEFMELESAKAVAPVIAPVAGTIRYVNQAVSDDPEVINNDPYGEGWLVKIELEDDEPPLLDAEAYAKLVNKA